MIPKQEVMALAAELQLQAHIVEKDYALGWFLAGIAAHPVIGSRWVFKGGACLKKCYFETIHRRERGHSTRRHLRAIWGIFACAVRATSLPASSSSAPLSSSALTRSAGTGACLREPKMCE